MRWRFFSLEGYKMAGRGLRHIVEWIGDRLHKHYEPEYEERVEHDTVMAMVDGKLVEVTGDAVEEGE